MNKIFQHSVKILANPTTLSLPATYTFKTCLPQLTQINHIQTRKAIKVKKYFISIIIIALKTTFSSKAIKNKYYLQIKMDINKMQTIIKLCLSL